MKYQRTSQQDNFSKPSPIFPSNPSPIPTLSPTVFHPLVFLILGSPGPPISIANNSNPQLSNDSYVRSSILELTPVKAPPYVDSASADFETQSWPRVEENFAQWAGTKIRKAKFDATECREAFGLAITCMSYCPNEEIADISEMLLRFRDVLQRELPPLIQRHPRLKEGIGVKKIYESSNKRECYHIM